MSSHNVTRAIWLAPAVALLVAACPSDVEDPDRFRITPGGCDQVEALIFAQRCANAACHEASKPAAGLDLISAGLASHIIEATSTPCRNRRVVVPGDPSASFLVEKLGTGVRCGSRMPLSRKPLSEDEIACVAQWVRQLGSQPAPSDAALLEGGVVGDAATPADAADAGAGDGS